MNQPNATPSADDLEAPNDYRSVPAEATDDDDTRGHSFRIVPTDDDDTALG